MTPQLDRRLAAGKVVLGGCEVSVTGDDPAWQCLECHVRLYRESGDPDNVPAQGL